MQEIVMIKGPNNGFFPATEEDAQKMASYKLGQGVTLRSTKMTEHNLKFHQKIIMLFRLCYDHFADRMDGGLVYRDHLVKPSFDTFREELTVLSGHYEVHHSLNGSFRARSTSLAYHNTTDEHKARIFSDVINAALRHVYAGEMPEEQLRNTVDKILAFDK